MRLEFTLGLLLLRPLAFGSEPPAPLSVDQARAAGIDPLHDSQEVIKSKLLRLEGIENVPREAERCFALQRVTGRRLIQRGMIASPSFAP